MCVIHIFEMLRKCWQELDAWNNNVRILKPEFQGYHFISNIWLAANLRKPKTDQWLISISATGCLSHFNCFMSRNIP